MPAIPFIYKGIEGIFCNKGGLNYEEEPKRQEKAQVSLW
jgi:hypothetical protein